MAFDVAEAQRLFWSFVSDKTTIKSSRALSSKDQGKIVDTPYKNERRGLHSAPRPFVQLKGRSQISGALPTTRRTARTRKRSAALTLVATGSSGNGPLRPGCN